jgi:hypothetical protein
VIPESRSITAANIFEEEKEMKWGGENATKKEDSREKRKTNKILIHL